MKKIETFDEWITAIMNVLDINEQYTLLHEPVEDKLYVISMQDFINKALKTDGWQRVIMVTGDYICANELWPDGKTMNESKISIARDKFIQYIRGFTIGAIKAGYRF